MWDDFPKKRSAGNRALIIVILILTIGALGYSAYILFKPVKTDLSKSTPMPIESIKLSGSPTISPSPSLTPSLTPSPSPSGTPDYKVSGDETFVIASTADTNGDNKEETLVITKMANGKYHLYVLSSEGKVLFDNKELLKKPVRISTQTYNAATENYLSWMLVFTEQSGDLAFVHWNGQQYEIPQGGGI